MVWRRVSVEVRDNLSFSMSTPNPSRQRFQGSYPATCRGFSLCEGLFSARLLHSAIAEITAEIVAFLAAFAVRAVAIIFDIRMGPPNEFLKIGGDKP
jgi:hypothetical protein